MLCHRWAVPPTLSTYDKHYKNPVIDVTLLNQTTFSLVSRGSAGKSRANPYLMQEESLGAWRRVEEDTGETE